VEYKEPSKKKVFIVSGTVVLVIAGIVAAVLVFIFSRQGVAVNSGTFSSSSLGFSVGIQVGAGARGISNVSNNTWTASLNSGNGTSRVDYTFTAACLDAFSVRSENAEGEIRLVLIQGDAERTFDITGNFNQNIDLSDFEPGRIRLRLEFESARDVDTLVSW